MTSHQTSDIENSHGKTALTYTDSYRTGTGVRRWKHFFTIGLSMLVFVASVWYICRTFQWQDLGEVLKHVDLICLFVGGSAASMLYWMLRTLRWQMLLRRTDTHVPIIDLYLCSVVSLSFSLITPFQSGEVIKIEFLKKYGMIQRLPGYSTFLVEKVLDLATLLMIASVSLLTTLNILPNRVYAYWIIGSLVLVCSASLYMLAKLKLKGRPQQLLECMRQCVGDKSTFLLLIAITCASWAAVAFAWQVFLSAGGIHLGFVKTVAVMSSVAVIGILSLIPGGVGVSEAGTAQLLMHFGISTAVAQAGSLLIRFISLWALVLGTIHLGLWKLIRIWRNKSVCQAAGKNM